MPTSHYEDRKTLPINDVVILDNVQVREGVPIGIWILVRYHIQYFFMDPNHVDLTVDKYGNLHIEATEETGPVAGGILAPEFWGRLSQMDLRPVA